MTSIHVDRRVNAPIINFKKKVKQEEEGLHFYWFCDHTISFQGITNEYSGPMTQKSSKLSPSWTDATRENVEYMGFSRDIELFSGDFSWGLAIKRSHPRCIPHDPRALPWKESSG
ncbi:uncharacterized protein LOC122574456 [Bombus pyrosoma]|uniref:uncharacterized protein LOC122574456 n=1 Tax=Bombus pyrosoma TaxID=396416 RepID=UPI001CB92557|nr:uncharacterized protein LOC122574456 [Bombus pyrosoma]